MDSSPQLSNTPFTEPPKPSEPKVGSATPPVKILKSSKLFAMAPVHALIDTPVDQMTQDQLREFVQYTRNLRTSPPSFSKQLREEEESEELAEAKPAKARKAPSKAKVQQQKILNEYL